MNHQDTGTIIITFLLLLPWLGRAAVSAIAHVAGTHRNARQESKTQLLKPICLADGFLRTS